jgi:hypothetical protein
MNEDVLKPIKDALDAINASEKEHRRDYFDAAQAYGESSYVVRKALTQSEQRLAAMIAEHEREMAVVRFVLANMKEASQPGLVGAGDLIPGWIAQLGSAIGQPSEIELAVIDSNGGKE